VRNEFTDHFITSGAPLDCYLRPEFDFETSNWGSFSGAFCCNRYEVTVHISSNCRSGPELGRQLQVFYVHDILATTQDLHFGT
jgi:hypothetical protein